MQKHCKRYIQLHNRYRLDQPSSPGMCHYLKEIPRMNNIPFVCQTGRLKIVSLHTYLTTIHAITHITALTLPEKLTN